MDYFQPSFSIYNPPVPNIPTIKDTNIAEYDNEENIIIDKIDCKMIFHKLNHSYKASNQTYNNQKFDNKNIHKHILFAYFYIVDAKIMIMDYIGEHKYSIIKLRCMC